MIGGGGGIRTHGTVSGTAVFKTAALNHSTTPPRGRSNTARRIRISVARTTARRKCLRSQEVDGGLPTNAAGCAGLILDVDLEVDPEAQLPVTANLIRCQFQRHGDLADEVVRDVLGGARVGGASRIAPGINRPRIEFSQ